LRFGGASLREESHVPILDELRPSASPLRRAEPNRRTEPSPVRDDLAVTSQEARPQQNLIGVDIGSTSVKAALVTSGQGIVHVARRPTITHPVRGGGAYHLPSEILAAVESAIAECARVAGRSKVARPAAIGIASMSEAGVPVDRRNQPVGEILAWHDPRPQRQAAFLERQVGAARLFARTGLRAEPKYTLPKLLWLREQRAADFSRLQRWAGVAELAALDLTGQLGTNASLASRTLAFDVTKRVWDAELLAFASLKPEEMPRVQPLGEAVGTLTPAAAKRLGMVTGTPVAIGGHDHLATAIGAGVATPGDALDSMGSAEATLVVTSRPVLDDEVRRGGFSAGCHAIDGLWYIVGGLQSSGALVEWFVRAFLGGPGTGASTATAGAAASTGPSAAVARAAASTGTSAAVARAAASTALSSAAANDGYVRFAELLSKAGSGPVEPIVQPYLRGRTAPHPDSTATLEFGGLREEHGLPDMAAAIIDGAAFHVRWMLDELARVSGISLERVRVAGGGARNKRWLTAKAALGPGRLEVVRAEECGALGAALVAGVAGGVYGSIEEALADASAVDRLTAPATVRARYDAAYLDRWLPLVITRLRQNGLF
jgi:xylulokinase